MDKARLESRRKDFKKSIEDPRRRREDAAMQIRKATREAQVLKKRAQSMHVASSPLKSVDIQNAVQSVLSDDPLLQLEATQQFRKLLAVDHRPPIQAVIDTGIVPRLISFLTDNNRPDLQLEAAWTLTNIASGSQDQTKVVTDNGAVPIFVDLLKSPIEDVRDQAVWAIGNIAGDCPTLRDMVLNAGGLDPLLMQLHDKTKEKMMRNATWALSNLCRGTPPPKIEMIAPAIPMLKNLIFSNDCEILTDACWALSYLLDSKTNNQIDLIISSGLCIRLVELLLHPSEVVQNPALRAIGQVIAGTNAQAEVAIQAGVLCPLSQMLACPKMSIRKETCWVISNVAAGTQNQIQALINAGIIEPLIHLMRTAEFEVKREVAWAVSNAVIGGNVEQVEFIVNCNCVRPLCDLLCCQDKNTVQVSLEAIDNILLLGEKKKTEMNLVENPYVQLVEEADGFTKLERLQFTDPDSNIYKAVIRILTSYFPVEEQDYDMNQMTNIEMGFGAAIPQDGFNFRAGGP